jgi:hypothetical protein
MPRRQIDPPLKCTFQQVYDAIGATPHKEIAGLWTTGGGAFWALAPKGRDGKKYIALPHKNRTELLI